MPVIALAEPSRVPTDVVSAPADPAAIIDAVLGLDPGADVLLVADGPAGGLAARSARLVLGGERVGLLVADVPDTAFYLAVAAARLLPDDALGLAGAVAAVTWRSSVTQVLLSSVSALSHPAPSLLDHAASAWPGSRFLVDWTAGTVTRAASLQPPEGRLAVVARSVNGWDDVDQSAWPQARIDLPPVDGRSRWGAARWLELTTLAPGVQQVTESVLGVRDHVRCRSCARLAWGERCLFCQLPLDHGAVDAPVLTEQSRVEGRA